MLTETPESSCEGQRGPLDAELLAPESDMNGLPGRNSLALNGRRFPPLRRPFSSDTGHLIDPLPIYQLVTTSTHLLLF